MIYQLSLDYDKTPMTGTELRLIIRSAKLDHGAYLLDELTYHKALKIYADSINATAKKLGKRRLVVTDLTILARQL